MGIIGLKATFNVTMKITDGYSSTKTVTDLKSFDNNNIVFTFVCVDKSKDLKKDINVGDFVLVGIEEVKKPFTTESLDKVKKGKNSKETAWNLSQAMVYEAPRGLILKKLTLELDIKTGQFVFDE
jgi:hypothetical protein